MEWWGEGSGGEQLHENQPQAMMGLELHDNKEVVATHAMSSRWYPEIHSKAMPSLLSYSATWGQSENDSPTQKSVHSALESTRYIAHPQAQLTVKCLETDCFMEGGLNHSHLSQDSAQA